MKGGTETASKDPSGRVARFELRITEGMLQHFSDLTGDRSSLHADEAFAARSLYRRRVVHGMLPVAFIPAVRPVALHGQAWSLLRISGQFLKPVFVNDRLALRASVLVGGDGADEAEVEYVFTNAESGATVTTARAAYRPLAAERPRTAGASAGEREIQGTLVKEGLAEQDLRLEQIAKGQGASLGFQISTGCLRAWRDLIAEGVAPEHTWARGEDAAGGLANLLAACLVSTFAGMCLPGKYATLLDFTLSFAKPLRVGTDYRLRGTVEHKSEATGTVTERLVIEVDTNGAQELATGKATVRVDEGPTRGPTLEVLRKTEMDLQLKDRVVLITGASRGIGETAAKLFALHGAKVVVNYRRSQEEAMRVVEEICEGGGDAWAVQADVSSREEVRRLVAAACERYQTVHVLVNNAVGDFYPVPFRELTWERMQQDLDVVLKGAFQCCQEVLSHMIRNGGGKIINLSSVTTDHPPPGQTKYVVAKSALTGLTRSLAVELAPHNIQVNLVVASMVETDLVKHVPKIFLKGMKNDTPLKRHATTGDVAKAILFLASSLSSFTTGQRIVVAGGNPPFL